MGSEPSRVVKVIDKYQLWFFFITTILVSWLIGPYISLVYGVAIALILLLITKGMNGIYELLSGLTRWYVGLRWYVFAIFVTIIVGIAAVTLATVFGRMSILQDDPLYFFGYLLSAIVQPLLFLISLISAVCTIIEFGYVLPILLKRHTPLVAGLVLGIVTFVCSASSPVYHYLFGQNSILPNILMMAITLIPFIFIIVWLYHRSRNSLLLAALCLLYYQFVGIMIGTTDPVGYFAGGIYILICIVLIVVDRANVFNAPPPDNEDAQAA